jgi:RNA polymerase sigma-70 factor (ECF subfamily)
MMAQRSVPALVARVEHVSIEAGTDTDLVRRALAGDRWAKGAIYRRHAPMVLNAAARVLGDRSDAMDVLQDVFVDALGDLHALRNPAALRGWLLQRTVRRVRRSIRRRSMRRWLGIEARSTAADLDAILAADVSPDVRLELAKIWSLLDSLPARQRIAWVLHRVEGETLPAVAEACGVSLATIKREIAAATITLAAHTEGRRP